MEAHERDLGGVLLGCKGQAKAGCVVQVTP